MDSGKEQQLGPVHVADPGDHLLVEQGGPDRDGPAAEPAPEFVGSIGGIEDRIRTESSAEIVLVLRGDELARRRAGEVQMIGLGLHDEPRIRRRLRRRQRPNPKFAEQSEMHVQDVALVEPVEEMLSERVDAGDGLAVEGRSSVGETSLR